MMRRLFLKRFRRRRLQQDLETELAFHRAMSGQHHNPIPLGNEAMIKEQAFDLCRLHRDELLHRAGCTNALWARHHTHRPKRKLRFYAISSGESTSIAIRPLSAAV